MSESSETGQEVEPSSKRGSARGLRRIGIALLLFVLAVLVLGPPLAGRFLRGRVEAIANGPIDGRVTLESLSLALNGKATLRGLTVEDASGALVASIPSARLDVGLRALLTGKKDVALLVDGAQIELVRDAAGTWNVATLPATRPASEGGGGTSGEPPAADEPAGGPDGPDRPAPPQSPPDVHGRLEFVNATITMRSPETAMELRDVHFTIGLDGGDEDTALRLDATLFGGEGSVGDFHADVSLWPGAGPGLELVDVSATGVDLGAVAELLRLAGSPLEEGSSLAGSVDLIVRGGLADLRPDAAFSVEVEGAARGLAARLVGGGDELFAFDATDGTLQLRAVGEGDGASPRATAQIRARGGKLAVDATWDGAAPRGFVANLEIDALEASAGLEPYLARVHPAFATASAFDGASLGGLVSSEIMVEYDAPLPLESLIRDGDVPFALGPFRATGTLRVDEGLVRTSPFVGQLLEAFGEPADPTFDLKPLGFAVDDGRIAYTNPWTWTIEGTETRFVGSVGLDRSLDLQWVVPVTDGLAEQNRVFRALEGETFEVALTGSLTSPRFLLADALASLAQSKLEQEVRRQRERLLEGVGDDAAAEAIRGILDGADPGRAVEQAAKGILSGDADAATLLEEADRLWDSGKRQAAGEIYRKIRSDFPLSPTYLLNKSRIKRRRNG